MKIIDAHVHLYEVLHGFGYIGGARCLGGGVVEYDNGARVQKFPAWLGDKGVTAESFLEFMDRQGIEKAVLMQGPGYGLQNSYYSEIKQRFPDRFYPAAMVDPEIYRFSEVLTNLLEKGFRIFKLEMSAVAGLTGCHWRLDTFASDNMNKLLDAVQGVGGTMVFDIGGPSEPSYQIEAIRCFAEAHPSLKIVMCHLLEPDDRDLVRLRDNLRRLSCDNIWFDISSLPTILNEEAPYAFSSKLVGIARDIVGAGRLMWGTDSPGCLVKHVYYELLRAQVLENPALTGCDREKILYENATHVYLTGS